MTPEENIAYIHSQIACMYAELEAMKAANDQRARQGYAQEYGEDAFLSLPEKYGLTHNQIITSIQATK